MLVGAQTSRQACCKLDITSLLSCAGHYRGSVHRFSPQRLNARYRYCKQITYRCSRRASKAHCCFSSHPPKPAAGKRYAIIGGGFAGVAVAHHLSLLATATNPVTLDLIDLAGLGAGGSGAAGGLLHPFSPKGKVLWNGWEAFQAALDLVAAAEDASQLDAAQQAKEPQKFVWRQDMLRPATDAKQAAGFSKLQSDCHNMPAQVEAISGRAALQLLPGLRLDPSLLSDPAAALLIKGGMVLQPQQYLRNLWRGCQQRFEALDNSSSACLQQRQVQSLTALEVEHGPYDAVIVAAGAAAGVLPEVGDKLPIRLCQGYGVEFVPDGKRTLQADVSDTKQSTRSKHQTATNLHNFPAKAPSLVGATYVGAQGSTHISVGATKQYGYTAEQALQECSRSPTDPAEIEEAERLIRPAAEGLWAPLANWQVSHVVSGVRALPPKTAEGALPLAGRLESSHMHGRRTRNYLGEIESLPRSWWVVGGLGARGLVYHAWLGALLAQAISKGSEDCLPRQLLRWKTTAIHK